MDRFEVYKAFEHRKKGPNAYNRSTHAQTKPPHVRRTIERMYEYNFGALNNAQECCLGKICDA